MPVLWSVMRAIRASTSCGCKFVALNKYSVFTLDSDMLNNMILFFLLQIKSSLKLLDDM